MPFQSKAQQGYLFQHNPAVAQEFAKATPSDLYKRLPEHVAKKKPKRHRRKRRRGHAAPPPAFARRG